MKIGSKVIYKNQQYVILWAYKNGTCEIVKKGNHQVILVPSSDLIEVNNQDSPFQLTAKTK
jgi:hypothetical protein